jgi:hypothetical protein
MKKIILYIFISCFLLNSCSRLDLAVNFADTYIVNKTDNYFDLTSEQKKWLNLNFDKDFSKVKEIIFPRIASELFKAANMISSKAPLGASDIKLAYERLNKLFYDGLQMFSSDAVLLVDQLNTNQIIYFQKEFDKKMKELQENENSKDSYKKMKKQFDSWLGEMTSLQKKELESFTTANPPLTNEIVNNRQLLAHEFVSSYYDQSLRRKFVEKIMNHFGESYEANFSIKMKERNNKIIELTTSILNQITNEQREILVNRLKDRANQLLKISKK